jgi:WD40 repeat protein
VLLEPFEDSRHLSDLAKQEIGDLLRRDDADLAVDIFGLLAAAAGPLAVSDLTALTGDLPGLAVVRSRSIRRLVTEDAARSLQPVGPADAPRYQFAHASLLEYAQADAGLRDPAYRRRIYEWAEQWRKAGWPATDGVQNASPRYLLDAYPATLDSDPQRLAALAGDVSWVAAAIRTAGVDSVLAALRTARSAAAADEGVSAMLALVRGQAHHLRPPDPVSQPGYVLRQLCLQAAELADERLALDTRTRLLALADPGPVPLWSTRRSSQAPSAELGSHDGPVWAVAVLPGGRVVTGGHDGRVRVWDPATAGAAPLELGSHDGPVRAVAVLPGGRVVTSGDDGRVRVWDLAMPGAAPLEPGRHDASMLAIAVLPDGRVVTGGEEGRVRVWDPAMPGAAPLELGSHDGWVSAVAVLPDGRVVTAGGDPQVRVWEPGRAVDGPLDPGDRPVLAVAVLPDGRVVTGGEKGRVRVWDPAAPGAAPLELGSHKGQQRAVAVLPDGRVVTGGTDPQVRVWDPAAPGAAPLDLGSRDGGVRALAVLADGRVVTGGDDGRVRVWDPAAPGAAPLELGSHDGWTGAGPVAVLADGRVVTGGTDHRVRVWDVLTRAQFTRIACPVFAFATAPFSAVGDCHLVVAHGGSGMSGWAIRAHPETQVPN